VSHVLLALAGRVAMVPTESAVTRPALSPEDAAPALCRRRWVPWIDGRRSERNGRDTMSVLDPATGRELAHIELADQADVDAAVAAALTSLPGWSQVPGLERTRRLWRWADLIEQNARAIASLDVLENGMPAAHALALIQRTADTMRELAGWASKLTGVTTDQGADTFAYTVRGPVGVVGTICPWNAPAAALVLQATPALAAGCTVVGKPSELTPLTALLVSELAADAGLPGGVLNVVPGTGRVAGEHLARHPQVARISFMGSTATGRRIIENSAVNMKRLNLELGGKSPDIIFADADLPRAVAGAALGIFNNAGQVCVAGSRLLVQDRCYDEVVTALEAHARALVIGGGFDPATEVGPLISGGQRKRVQGFVDDAVANGAELVLGGAPLDSDWNTTRNFYQPTIICGVKPDMRVAREEVFGPVVNVVPFTDDEEALTLANDTEFGLAGGLWTRDLSRAHRMARMIRSGMLWVNCYYAWVPTLPHGGLKQSGYGAKYGQQSVLDNTVERTVVIRV
jgi:acyl-CoA reductase-like NAD-dependent aldehyde dehydrogenase